MTDFESTYFEEFDASENYEEEFIIDSLILENAQTLLNDDKIETIDCMKVKALT